MTGPLTTAALRARFDAGEPVRRDLPEWGRLVLDRPLPALVLYRRPPVARDAGTPDLVTGTAAYLCAGSRTDAGTLVEAVAGAVAPEAGPLLLVEVWAPSEPGEGAEADPTALRPRFTIYRMPDGGVDGPAEALREALGEVVVHGQRATVDVHTAEQPGPPGLPALAWPRRIGLEVAPVYRDAETEEVYPYLLASLRRQLTEALECAAYRYACTATPLGPPHPTALGRRHLEPAAQEVDRRLAEASGTFRFLLQVTPVNAREAKARFFEGGCEQGPTFQYRPLPVDPERLKRDLFALPVEAVEDPVLAELFREKQEELDRRVTMLRDRGTRRFFYGSLALYGEPSEALRALAHELLARLPDSDDPAAEAAPPGTVDAAGFAAAAAAEFDAYRAACPDFPAYPDLRGDIPPGLLVSQGQLLIGQGTTVPHARVEALVQHEVGTHMATYYNGRAQPLEVLRIGLAHYEALQEGLAVLAEYVVGGLTVPRLRVLAARVVAAQALIDDASFVEVFRLLTREHGFDRDTAWTVAMRTFRGGGMIKDVIYLRGLDELARHLREGGALEPLLVGKLALHHLPAVEALRRRGVLSAPLLRPRWLDAPHAPEALERLRAGLTFVDLFARSPEPSTPPA